MLAGIFWCAMVLSKGDDDDDDGHGDGSISMMFRLQMVSQSGQSVGLQGDFAVKTSGSLAIRFGFAHVTLVFHASSSLLLFLVLSLSAFYLPVQS